MVGFIAPVGLGFAVERGPRLLLAGSCLLMARFFLLLLLFGAIVLELVLTGGAFFAPAIRLGKFGVKCEPGTRFLAYLAGWFLLSVSAVAMQASV